jgi:hypothetical protein
MTQRTIDAMSTTFTITTFRGKPTVMHNGVSLPAYTYAYPLGLDLPAAEEAMRRFAAHGCRTFMATVRGGVGGDWFTTPFWTDDGIFPEITDPDEVATTNVVRQVELILRYAPDARFWVRMNSATPPARWREKHPDHLLLNGYGKRFDDPSLASDLYATQVGQYVENVVRFCERQPWGDRVLGYVIYPLGEGTTVLTSEGYLFDCSPVMQAGFRGYLTRRYRTDAALRDAWGRPEVSLEDATIPDEQAWRARASTDFPTMTTANGADHAVPHRLHWPEPHEAAAERDYCGYMRELTERYLNAILGAMKRTAPGKLAGIDGFKQTMLGWPLTARWAGDYQTHAGSQHAVSGAFGMAELLDLPDLDVVATPHDYLNRGMGFGYEGEGIGDSVVRRGKLMLMEEDQRTFSSPAEKGRWNVLRNMDEVRAGLWRNLGASLSRGYNTYPMDISDGRYFTHNGIQEILAARKVVHEAATGWHRHEVPCAVMIVDDWSVLDEDFTLNYQYLSVIQQRLHGLSRCGVPFRLHLLEDLARDDFPACHRLFLFPNLFRFSPGRLALLKEKVFRNGNVAIFGPATGITDGSRLSAEDASELTGIPLTLIRKESPRLVTLDRFNHPVTANLPRLDFGDSYAYGPLLVPQGHPLGPAPHPDIHRLGGIQWPGAYDGDGLVIREFGRGAAGNGRPGGRGDGDYATVFSCAVPLPDVLLREFARFSGTHVYGEADDLVFADSCSLTVHSVRPGTRRIRLPGPTAVWDLIRRQQIGEALTEIEIRVQGPQTEMFYLGSDDPFGN